MKSKAPHKTYDEWLFTSAARKCSSTCNVLQSTYIQQVRDIWDEKCVACKNVM